MLRGTWVSTVRREHRFVRFGDGKVVGPVLIAGRPFDAIVRHVLAWFERDETLPEHVSVATLTRVERRFSFPERGSLSPGLGTIDSDDTITVNSHVYRPLQRPPALDINTASADELAVVPGLGAARAKQVVVYRTTHGPLRGVEALSAIKGLSRKALAAATPWLTA